MAYTGSDVYVGRGEGLGTVSQHRKPGQAVGAGSGSRQWEQASGSRQWEQAVMGQSAMGRIESQGVRRLTSNGTEPTVTVCFFGGRSTSGEPAVEKDIGYETRCPRDALPETR
jgi:hypothetical protein